MGPAPYEPTPIRARQGGDRTPDEWRRYRFAYHRIVEKVDAEIGKILAALDRLNLTEDTLVIFASDHGENCGAHGLAAKLSFNDESARVPFIMRWPSRFDGGRVETDALVSAGLDLYPTICAAAGIESLPQRPGENLLPVAEQGSTLTRKAVYSMTRSQGGCQGRMVRTLRYKYVAYEGGQDREQLFDMEVDPGEMVNLAVSNRFADVLQHHRELLRSWCKETGESFGYHYTHPRVPFFIPGDEYAPDSGGLPADFPLSEPPA
jgi:arylsulfatase A-like enzyme